MARPDGSDSKRRRSRSPLEQIADSRRWRQSERTPFGAPTRSPTSESNPTVEQAEHEQRPQPRQANESVLTGDLGVNQEPQSSPTSEEPQLDKNSAESKTNSIEVIYEDDKSAASENHSTNEPLEEGAAASQIESYWNNENLLKAMLTKELPPDKTAIEELLPICYEFPSDFEQKLHRATVETADFIRADLEENAAQKIDEDSSAASLESFQMPVENDTPTKKDGEIDISEYELLIEGLTKTPAFLYGFHSIISGDYEQWCCCPFGPKMGVWQQQGYIQGWDEQKRCKYAGRVRPAELISHLEQLSKKCRWHCVALKFLEFLYEQWVEIDDET